MVGAGYAASTGSLKQGLMAGLGAYGGAGMASSFGTAGAASVAPEAAVPLDAAAAATPPPPAPITVDPTAAVNPMRGIPTPAPSTVDPTAAVNPMRGIPTPTPTPTPTPAAEVAAAPVASSAPVTAPAPAQWNPNQPFANQTMVSPASAPAPVPAPTVEAPVPAPVPAPTPVAEAAPETFSTNPADYKGFEPGVNKYGAFGESPTNIDFKNMTASQRLEAIKSGASFDNLGDWASNNKMQAYGMGASAIMPWDEEEEKRTPYRDSDPGQQYTYEANATSPTPMSDPYGREQKYFNQRYVARAADGGMMASGGISDAHYNLGGYSDGGRLLRGPGDGVSDSIPAVIGKKQPARLADGEFVVPARIVSELGNGSTEAGARKLYAMMDRIQKARGKTVGKGKVAKNSRAEKYLPA